jgi:hypothetical protein
MPWEVCTVVSARPFWRSPGELNQASSSWREIYNWQRPHEAIGNEPPGTRYRPSTRPYRDVPQAFEYLQGDLPRRVSQGGLISFRGRTYRIGRAFTGEHVALRAVADGVWHVYYYLQRIKPLDLSQPQPDL